MYRKLILILFCSMLLFGCQNDEGKNVNGQKEYFDFTLKGKSQNWIIKDYVSGIYYSIEEKLEAKHEISIKYRGNSPIDDANIEIEKQSVQESVTFSGRIELNIQKDIFISMTKQVYSDFKNDKMIATITWEDKKEEVVLEKQKK
ncbi:hypothetical protein KO561_14585 [Radiobacillus kanasensis]|uniref:hypothetical protein n=1 Tax=Radiobacillus kanasensis TaxID=2844358 RepID=UPI001E4202EB|nr:hypothetical protein [Radiobacillus kanasensis]UFT98415.1 hypothetical protein KO561_14585 [Radiobacillus kanasensis]